MLKHVFGFKTARTTNPEEYLEVNGEYDPVAQVWVGQGVMAAFTNTPCKTRSLCSTGYCCLYNANGSCAQTCSGNDYCCSDDGLDPT